jgi:PBP1b-binding outer membrane lipoprotein LpoB
MRLSPLTLTLLIAIASIVSGCRTPSSDVDSQKVMYQLNNEDLTDISHKMALSLLESGTLDEAPQKPAVITIGRVVNKTSQRLDTDWFARRFCTILLKSGKATCAATGWIEAPSNGERSRSRAEAMMNANWRLSGEISESLAKPGRTTSRTYFVNLTLTDVKANVIVWSDDKEITKAAENSPIGHAL